jgi:putative endonuclease
MYTFYILHSTQLNKHYIGFTGDLIEDRLRKHLSDHSGFTSKAKDWLVVHVEHFQLKSDAARREKEVKAWKSATKIRALYSLD